MSNQKKTTRPINIVLADQASIFEPIMTVTLYEGEKMLAQSWGQGHHRLPAIRKGNEIKIIIKYQNEQ